MMMVKMKKTLPNTSFFLAGVLSNLHDNCQVLFEHCRLVDLVTMLRLRVRVYPCI